MILLRRWKLILALVVVFVAGLAVGIAGTLRAVQKRIQDAQNPATWTPRTLDWLRKELRLTPEQEEKVRPAVEEAVAELKDLRDNADRTRRALIGRMLFQVSDHLDETQREKLRDIVANARKKEIPQGGQVP
jgi:hypothetical protein